MAGNMSGGDPRGVTMDPKDARIWAAIFVIGALIWALAVVGIVDVIGRVAA